MSENWSIDPTASLDRIANHSRGGYCYQMNGALSLVLGSLGYHVTRHIGGVHGPEGPDVKWLSNHLVLVAHDLPTAENPNGDWWVDAGLGDGLYDPLPMISGTYAQNPMTFRFEETDDGVGDWHFTHDSTGSFSGMSFRTGQVEMDACRRTAQAPVDVPRIELCRSRHRPASTRERDRHSPGMRPHPTSRARVDFNHAG